MPSPLVSVCLCTYNGARFLRQQMDSVLAQAGATLEIVAVDDASTDGSIEILRDYANRDARIRVFQNDINEGPTATFARAMHRATGEFIAPCDQDDVWLPDKVAKLLAAIGDCDLAYCDSALIDAEGTPRGERLSQRMPMLHGRLPLRFVFANSVSGHALLVRASLLEKANPFPADVFHDWWLALCAASNRGIAYLDEPLVQFRRHAGAFSRIGRGGSGKVKNRGGQWLAQRRSLLVAFAQSGLNGRTQAQSLRSAFDAALDGPGAGPLLREIWRLRRELAEDHCATQAVRLQLRCLRKLRTAAREKVRGVA